jgi:hypothetical protein
MYQTFRDDPPWRRIVIMNGVRVAADLGYRDDQAAAAATAPGVPPPATRSRPTRTGRVAQPRGRFLEPAATAPWSARRSNPGPATCTSGQSIDDRRARSASRSRGFRKRHHPGDLHLEKYWTVDVTGAVPWFWYLIGVNTE